MLSSSEYIVIERQENAFSKSSSPGYTPRDSNQVDLGRDLELKLRGNVHPGGILMLRVPGPHFET